MKQTYKTKRIAVAVMSLLFAAATVLGLLCLKPQNAKADFEPVVQKGTFSPLTPWKNSTGAAVCGSAIDENGNYQLVLGDSDNHQGEIINTDDLVNIRDFEITLDFSNAVFQGEHKNASLVFANVNTGASLWRNDYPFFRFDKNDDGTMNIHLGKDSNFTYYAASFAVNVPLTDGKLVFKMSADEDAGKMLFDFNGVKAESPLADWIGDSRVFWEKNGETVDPENMYITIFGSTENYGSDNYITVSPVNDANMKAHKTATAPAVAKIDDYYEKAQADLTVEENMAAAKAAKEAVEELDMSVFREYEKKPLNDKIKAANELLGDVVIRAKGGVFDRLSPWQSFSGSQEAVGSMLLEDGGTELVFTPTGNYEVDIINTQNPVNIEDFGITLDFSEKTFASAHQNTALVLRTSKEGGAQWGNNNLFIRFDKQSAGKYNVGLYIDSNFNQAYNAAFATDVAAENEVVAVDVKAEGDKLVFNFNETRVEAPLADFVGDSRRVCTTGETDALYLSVFGKVEGAADDVYVKVSEVRGANMTAYKASVAETIDAIANLETAIKAVSSKTLYRAFKTDYEAINKTQLLSVFNDCDKIVYGEKFDAVTALYAAATEEYDGLTAEETAVYGFKDAVDNAVVYADVTAALATYEGFDVEAIAASEFGAELEPVLTEYKAKADALKAAFEAAETAVAAYEALLYTDIAEIKASRTAKEAIEYTGLSDAQAAAYKTRVSAVSNAVETKAGEIALKLTSGYETSEEASTEREDIEAAIAAYEDIDIEFVGTVSADYVTRINAAKTKLERKLAALEMGETEILVYNFENAVKDVILASEITALETRYAELKENDSITDSTELLERLETAKGALDGLKTAFAAVETAVAAYEGAELPADSDVENAVAEAVPFDALDLLAVKITAAETLKNAIDMTALSDARQAAYKTRIAAKDTAKDVSVTKIANAYVTAFGAAVNGYNSYAQTEALQAMYEAIPVSFIEKSSSADTIKASLAAKKAAFDAKQAELTPPTELTLGKYDERVPFSIWGTTSRAGSFYNAETDMYEFNISGEFRHRFISKDSFDLSETSFALDITNLPAGKHPTTSQYIGLVSKQDSATVDSGDYLQMADNTDIPLLISIVKYNTGSVSLYFWRNWFVDASGADPELKDASGKQVILNVNKSNLLEISTTISGENLVFTCNESSVNIPLSYFSGENRKVFTKNADLSKIYLYLAANVGPENNQKMLVRRFYTEDEKEYQASIAANVRAYNAAKDFIAAGLDSNLKIAVAKRYIAKIDFSLFNEKDTEKYTDLVEALNSSVSDAIDALGANYDENYSIVSAFIAAANSLEEFEDIVTATELYSYLSDEEKATDEVKAAYSLTESKQNIGSWTKSGNLLAMKGLSDIVLQGAAFDDLLISGNKFSAANFEASLKFNTFGSGWIGFGLMANKNGFNSGVSIDTAENDRGLFLMIRKVDTDKINVEVYAIKSSTTDMWAALRGNFDATIDAQNTVKIRLYPDKDNRYIQIDVNGALLTNNRLRTGELNTVLGSEQSGYIVIQTCADSAAPAYFNLMLRTINNKSVFDTGVTNPDPNNIPDYGNGDPETPGDTGKKGCKGCKSSAEGTVAFALIALVAAALILLKKAKRNN